MIWSSSDKLPVDFNHIITWLHCYWTTIVVEQPWILWVNASVKSTRFESITPTKQTTAKLCPCFMGCTLHVMGCQPAGHFPGRGHCCNIYMYVYVYVYVYMYMYVCIYACYPTKNHLKLKSGEISFFYNIHLSSLIILKFGTEHGSEPVMPCAKFTNDWSTDR